VFLFCQSKRRFGLIFQQQFSPSPCLEDHLESGTPPRVGYRISFHATRHSSHQLPTSIVAARRVPRDMPRKSTICSPPFRPTAVFLYLAAARLQDLLVESQQSLFTPIRESFRSREALLSPPHSAYTESSLHCVFTIVQQIIRDNSVGVALLLSISLPLPPPPVDTIIPFPPKCGTIEHLWTLPPKILIPFLRVPFLKLPLIPFSVV